MNKVLALAPAVILFCGAILVPKAHANDDLIDWMMEEEQQTLDASLQELDPLLTANEEETTALTTDLQTAEAELVSTNTDIATTEASISDLEAQIAALEEQQSTADTTDTTDYDSQIATLQTQLTEQEAQLTSLESDATTLTTTITLTAEELEAAIQEQATLLEQINLANETFDTELALVTSQVGELSDKQIKSLLHTMNTTANNDIDVQLDSAELSTILDNDYSFQQTNLYLKAQTEEAKFLSKAEALRAEAEATGDTSLLEEAEKMEEIAAMKADRFEDLASGHPAKSEDQHGQDSRPAKQQKADNKPTDAGTANKQANASKGADKANKGKRK